MNTYDAIRILALHAVIKEDEDFKLRQVFRFYSREFNTPLHEVKDLPIEEVLAAYFESKYEDMDIDKLKIELHDTSETEEQKRRRIKESQVNDAKAEQDDMDFLKKIEQEAQALAKKQGDPSLKPEQIPPPLVDSKIPEEGHADIDMKFVSEDEMETMLESDSFGLFDDFKK